MLKIQRASAGSGKTYALAKTFIFNLIAFKNPEGIWKIRNEKQIEDALLHILAITFTNKATNEMKQRIINNLALLSKACNKQLTQDEIDDLPYLKEFHEITGEPHYIIGKAGEYALKTILNNYSNFKISTIDSFFQEILRTFTYESNIHESYQLEIDSTFVNDTAIDDTIHELDSHSDKMGNASFWLKTIIKSEAKKSQKWNPFNKKASSRSVYAKIRDAIKQLEKEDYKEIKESIDSFYNNQIEIDNLKNIYKELELRAENERNILLKKIKKSIDSIENNITLNNYKSEHFNKSFLSHLSFLKEMKLNEEFPYLYNKILNDQSVFLKKYRKENNELDQEALDLYDLVTQWNNPAKDSYYKGWLIYGELLPYLGLIIELRSFISKVLEQNNLIQISDTGLILKKIIGDDDAPFVFERLGNRINNFLIDEFQDTSGMQWKIISPLLTESNSKGEDSFIIGDPKQSIYRFRNADYTLITHDVPKAFPLHLEAGYSKEDNTNWRSNTLIVKFNNYFFKQLSSIVSELSLKNGLPTDFKELYSNVVQYPHDQNGRGYIEIRIIDKAKEENTMSNGEAESSKNDWFETQALSQIGPLISSLINRGYQQKDIVILVNTNEKGKNVVENLIEYNENLPHGSTKIDFISEESLLISSSPAVEFIINVFEKLSQPGFLRFWKNTDETHEEITNVYLNWNDLKFNYSIFHNTHPELGPSERMTEFLKEPDTDKLLYKTLSAVSTPTLASLVETFIKDFFEEEIRKKEALYLSSLQDLINEYSANHLNDPATFLEWWKSRASKCSVSAPEGLDAVQIMTIHKSKGLEFKCVILPFASDSFTPTINKDEWRWVKPTDYPDLKLPPILPVRTSYRLLGSIHEGIYKQYYDQIITDKINMYYVAFTRACNELYIFTKKANKSLQGIHDFINYILKDNGEKNFEFTEEERDLIINNSDLNYHETDNTITLGYPFSEKEIKMDNSKASSQKNIKKHYFNSYYINNKRPRLRSLASKVLPSGENGFASVNPIN